MQHTSDMQLLEITTAARADYVSEAIATVEQKLASLEWAPALQATLQARLTILGRRDQRKRGCAIGTGPAVGVPVVWMEYVKLDLPGAV